MFTGVDNNNTITQCHVSGDVMHFVVHAQTRSNMIDNQHTYIFSHARLAILSCHGFHLICIK